MGTIRFKEDYGNDTRDPAGGGNGMPTFPPAPNVPPPTVDDLGEDNGTQGPIVPLPDDTPRPNIGKPGLYTSPQTGNTTQYAGSGFVGRVQKREPLSPTALAPLARAQNGDYRINRFLGLYTREGRDIVPPGALADCTNFLINKKNGSLVVRNGYEAYTVPNGLNTSSGINLTLPYYFWVQGTEVPSAQTMKFTAGTTAGAVKYIYQSPFFPNSSTVNTGNLWWGENGNAPIKNGSITASGLKFTGGTAVADYYKYWLCFNSTRTEYVQITGSSFAAGDTTLAFLENVPSDWANGDTLVLYRHFHDNPTFVPAFNNVGFGRTRPTAIAQGNAFLFSGGQSSTVGNKPIWSGYIDHPTMFDGATKESAFTGTYVTEAEIKSTAGLTIGNAGTAATTAGEGLTSGSIWSIGFVLETDDGQRSALLRAGTHYQSIAAADLALTTTLTIAYARFNKRIRYINVFLAQVESTSGANIDWSKYYFVTQYDLTSTGWTYNESGAAPGNYSRAISLDITDWNGVTVMADGEREDLVSHLGTTEYTTSVVSFSKIEALNNRYFIGTYYDYTAALNYNDQIRFSGFAGNAVPQLNVHPDIGEFSETTVEQGDPSVIRGIVAWEDRLFVVKDNSCYQIPITANSDEWQLIPVAYGVGTDVDATVTRTPFGICFAKTGEDCYFWDGGYPKGVTEKWIVDFRALTPTAAWYDYKLKNLFLLFSSGNAYSMSFDLTFDGVFVWMKHSFEGNPLYLTHDEDGNVLFYGGNVSGAYKFSLSVQTDEGSAISAPYFKTAPIVLDEHNITQLKDWNLALETPAASGNVSVKATTAGASQSAAQTWVCDATLTRHLRQFSDTTGRGRRVEFEFNTASLAYSTALTVHELGFRYRLLPLKGSAGKTA